MKINSELRQSKATGAFQWKRMQVSSLHFSKIPYLSHLRCVPYNSICKTTLLQLVYLHVNLLQIQNSLRCLELQGTHENKSGRLNKYLYCVEPLSPR